MTSPSRRDVSVALFYEPADKLIAAKMSPHLEPLARSRHIELWTPEVIPVGSVETRAYTQRVESADVGVVLLSADALASEGFFETVIEPLISRADRDEVKFFLIHAQPCDFGSVKELAGRRVLPRDRRALSSFEGAALETALMDIAREIGEALDSLAQSELQTGVYEKAGTRDLPAAKAASGSLSSGRVVGLGGSKARRSKIEAADPSQDAGDKQSIYERRYSNLIGEVADARQRKTLLAEHGIDTAAIDREIVDHRRRARTILRPGDELGDNRYRLDRVLGRGGFGEVWRAVDRRDNKQVAIKVMHGAPQEERERYDRFVRGAAAMAKIVHDHDDVVRVLTPAVEEGRFAYFVMELMSGGTLESRVKEQRIDTNQGIDVIQRVGAALARAHARGIVHRDVKPQNILFDADDKAKLTDFDLVMAPDTTGGTRVGQGMGTLAYSAPELLRGHSAEAGPAADVFSLGMTLVFALRGKAPEPGDCFNSDPIIDALDCRRPLKAFLKRALAQDPARRYQDAQEFLDALDSAQTEGRGEDDAGGDGDGGLPERTLASGRRTATYDCALVGLGYSHSLLESARKVIDEWNARVSRLLKSRVEVAWCSVMDDSVVELSECHLGIVIIAPSCAPDVDARWIEGAGDGYILHVSCVPMRVYLHGDRACEGLAPSRRSQVGMFTQHIEARDLLTECKSEADLRDAILTDLTTIVQGMQLTRELVGELSGVCALDIDVRMTVRPEPVGGGGQLQLFETEQRVIVSIRNQTADTVEIVSVAFETEDGVSVAFEDGTLEVRSSAAREVRPRGVLEERVSYKAWAQMAEGRRVRAVVLTSSGRRFRSAAETAGTLRHRTD